MGPDRDPFSSPPIEGLERTRRLSAWISPASSLVVVAVLAALLQGLHSYLFPPLNYDFVIQASAAQSSLDGKSYSTASVDQAGRVTRTFVTQWPPAYSWAFAAALRLFGDPLRAALAIELAAVCVFFAAWWTILCRLEMNRTSLMALWTYWALASSPLFGLPPSDVVSIACYSSALGMIVAAAGRPSTRVWFAIAGAAAGAAAAVRYAYWPLVCVPIAAYVFVDRSRGSIPRVAAYVAGAVGPMAWTVATSMHGAGTLTSLGLASSAGPHWRQLARVPPVGAAPLGLDAAWSRLAASTPVITPWLTPAFWVITGLVVVVTAAWLGASLKTGDGHVHRRTAAFAGAATALLTVALVAALTLMLPAYRDGWTYADDLARYLAPVYPFVLVALIDKASARVWRPGPLIVVALLAISFASVAAYRAGRVVYYVTRNSEAYSSGRHRRAELLLVFRTVRAAREAGAETLYCDVDLSRQSIAVIGGAAAIRDGCENGIRELTTARQIISASVGADGRLQLRTTSTDRR